jgi:hypothetical protein
MAVGFCQGIAEGAAARKETDMTDATVQAVRDACGVLAQHADLVALDRNAAGTLEGLAARYQRAAAARGGDQDAPLDAERIYAARRAAVEVAQRRTR